MYGLVPFDRRSSSIMGTGFNDLYSVLDNFFADSRTLARRPSVEMFKLDVQDGENGYTVEAELPGVAKDELDIEFDDGRLTISVQREERVDDEGKNYIHRERRLASMARGIYLSDAKADGIEAKLDDGVLTVTVPKVAPSEAVTKVEVS